MFIECEDGIADWEQDFLREHLDLLERQLYRLHGEAEKSEDPDSFGIYDRGEYLSGIAFVLAQAYINSTYAPLRGDSRLDCLRQGPLLSCGVFAADLIDAAANFWKHSDEWGDESNARRGKACLRVLERAGIERDMSYPLNNALAVMADQSVPQFGFLADVLEQWRDAGRTKR